MGVLFYFILLQWAFFIGTLPNFYKNFNFFKIEVWGPKDKIVNFFFPLVCLWVIRVQLGANDICINVVLCWTSWRTHWNLLETCYELGGDILKTYQQLYGTHWEHFRKSNAPHGPFSLQRKKKIDFFSAHCLTHN